MLTVRVLTSDEVARAASQRLAPDTGVQCEVIDSFPEISEGRPDGSIMVGDACVEQLPPEAGESIPVLILLNDPDTDNVPEAGRRILAQVLGSGSGKWTLARAVQHLADLADAEACSAWLRDALEEKNSEVEIFNRIGMALGSERDTRRLLDLILTYARQLTAADSGSIYIIRKQLDKHTGDGRLLHFANTQSDTLSIPFQGTVMEISESSIAGYVAMHGEVLNLPDVDQLPAGCPYHYNAAFDRSVRYRTRSMLALPMRNNEEEIIGVLQLINKKRTAGRPLRPISLVDAEVLAFTSEDEQRALALGGQAAVALENSILYEEIERLFEGFIRASVTAIESRDPVTSGHTERVTQYALALAEAVTETQSGVHAEVAFTEEQMRELRYAALLHDVGKIGVREAVLGKAEKLYPGEMEVVKQRFELIRQTLRLDCSGARLDSALSGNADTAELEERLAEQLHEIDDYMRVILESNTPRVLPEDSSDILEEIGRRVFRTESQGEQAYLTEPEMHSLRVKRGSLTPEEFDEIRSHVVHTREFLASIPWSRNLLGVPDIAAGHHEMLNGSGYPDGLAADRLSPQARIMAVADIFDALTAPDRPYKKGMPVEKALAILDDEVQRGRLDADLVGIFKDGKVYETAMAAHVKSNSVRLDAQG